MQITNNGTKPICVPNSLDSGNYCIAPGATGEITIEQYQHLAQYCPDALDDITITPENPETLDTEAKILCDLQADGSQIEFRALPVFSETTGAFVSTRYATLLDVSVDYVPTGTVTTCKTKSVKSRQVCLPTGEKYMACMQVIDGVGQPTTTVYLLANGQDAGLTVGQIALLEFCKDSPIIQRLDMVDFIDPSNAIHFTRIVERSNGTVTATYDIDNTGAVYTPTGVVLSKEKDQEYKSTCYRALINGAGFTAGDVLEFNVVFDPRNPLTPHYLNRTNRNTLGNVFEQSPAGVTGTSPVLGTEVIPCEQYVECKKEAIAVEQKFYKQSGVPSNYVAYRIKDTRENQYGSPVDATSVYIHGLYGVNAGSFITLRGAGGVDYNGGSNPNGVLATDVASVQVMTDKALLDMGLAVGDAYYAVTNDNQSVWFLSPAAIALIPSATYLQVYSGLVDTWNSYDNKFDIAYIAPYTSLDISLINNIPIICTPIQEIKEQDTCTGEETYRYVIEDGAGNLVDATTVISGFDEANVYVTCPVTPVIEIPGGVLVPNGNTYSSFPTNTISFTVSAQSGSFDISFDSGATFLTSRKGSRTRGQGTIETIDVSKVVIVSNGDVDIIRETI